MDESRVTDREMELLRTIQEYSVKNPGRPPPTNKWLAQRLNIGTPQGISNLRRRLEEKGLLDPKVNWARLTDAAHRLLDDIYSPVPLQLIVVGEVRAGSGKRPDELRVEMSATPSESNEILLIPEMREATVFALRVVGRSMEYERIFDGDYIIVERFPESGERGPREGEMIVAEYLPYSEEQREDIPVDSLEGPTVKYYYSKDDRGFYRLSWRRAHGTSEYTIRTKYIRFIGRVIGVYRPITSRGIIHGM